MSSTSAHMVPSMRRIEIRGLLPVRRYWLISILTFAMYLAATLAGFSLRAPILTHVGDIAILWPPNGVLLAMFLVVAPRRWAAVIIAALFAHFAGQWWRGTPLWLMGVQFSHNLLLTLPSAALLRKIFGPGGFEFKGMPQAAAYVAVAALAMPAIAAILPAAVRFLTHTSSDFFGVWQAIALSSALTMTLVTPCLVVLFSWLMDRPHAMDAEHPASAVEFTLLYGGLAIVAIWVFDGVTKMPPGGIPALVYLPLPLVLWAALRFGAGGASFSLLLVGLSCLWSVNLGRGPFATSSPAQNVLGLQLFLLAASLPLFFLGAVMRGKEATLAALAHSEATARRQHAHLASIYRSAPVGLAFLNSDLRFVEINDFLAETHGRSVEDHLGRSLREILPPALADTAEQLCRRVLQTGEPDIDREMTGRTRPSPDQTRYWRSNHYPVRDENGAVFGVNVIIQDMTEHKRAEANLYQHQAALRASLDRIQDLAGRLITVQEEERSRIARELHDDVNQQLAALSMALSGLKRKMPINSSIRDDFDAVQRQTINLTEDVRNISHDLHPGILQHAGLVPALNAYCAEVRQRSGIETSFESEPGIRDIPMDASLCLYRVAQETLSNVVKHAQAGSVRVTLAAKERGLEMKVADDGRGFDAASPAAGRGLGLISMDERARLVRGRVTVESRPQQGTTVTVWVPQE
jgi:PAS domain S-box-containing protein